MGNSDELLSSNEVMKHPWKFWRCPVSPVKFPFPWKRRYPIDVVKEPLLFTSARQLTEWFYSESSSKVIYCAFLRTIHISRLLEYPVSVLLCIAFHGFSCTLERNIYIHSSSLQYGILNSHISPSDIHDLDTLQIYGFEGFLLRFSVPYPG